MLQVPQVFFFIYIYFIYLLERKGRKEERERNITVWLPLVHTLLGTWPATQACALTRNRTGDPLVHRPALNTLSHTSQGTLGVFNKWVPHCTQEQGQAHMSITDWLMFCFQFRTSRD